VGVIGYISKRFFAVLCFYWPWCNTFSK